MERLVLYYREPGVSTVLIASLKENSHHSRRRIVLIGVIDKRNEQIPLSSPFGKGGKEGEFTFSVSVSLGCEQKCFEFFEFDLVPPEMLAEKFEGARPGCVRRVLAVITRPKVGKRVSGIGIGIKHMRLSEPRQFGIEFFHVRWRWILIVFPEVPHERAVNVFGALERG
ncbi:MAG TPA: hypothetical protein VF452_13650 [Candidatus Binatia bacterium]